MTARKHSWPILLAVACITAAHGQDRVPLTEDGGQQVGDNQNSRTAGERGGVLLDNFHLIQKLARFDRERIPERVVHARGVGAHGEFVSYDDWSRFTKASLFSAKDKKTPVFVRISTVIHPKGSPEQLRDPRGFATKFYTDQGNWDLVGNNLPVFFIRDAMKFPDMVHSLKPSPITNQQDPNRFFDFFSHVPESTHMLTLLYTDQGTPSNLRQMDGFGVHAFKWVNAQQAVTYVKFNWRSMQGHEPMSAMKAGKAAAENHSGHTADLYDAINRGDFPSWELTVQMMKSDQLDSFEFDPLDATKVWTGVPETKVGRMTLNRVPDNFFQATEQVAFSPGMVVPGIEPSEDRLLQGRLFSYADTQRYRLGANYLSLPINRPQVAVRNINQDGRLNHGQSVSDVNYQPSVVSGTGSESESAEYSRERPSGTVNQRRIAKPLDFKQAGELFRSLSETDQAALVSNFAGDLGKVVNRQVTLRILSFVTQADADYGRRLTEAVGESLRDVNRMIEANQKTEPTRWRTIALSQEEDANRIVVRNNTSSPVRYRVRTATSQWSPVYTLLPYKHHTYDRASLTLGSAEPGNAKPVTAMVGQVVDLARDSTVRIAGEPTGAKTVSALRQP